MAFFRSRNLYFCCPEMTRRSLVLLCALTSSLASCGDQNSGKDPVKKSPKPGTIVASAEMPVSGDSLNHFIFSIKVVADSNVALGVYDVDADYGPNFAEGQFTMPKGGEDLVPVIRKENANRFI